MAATALERVKKWASETHEKPNSVEPWSDVHVEGLQMTLTPAPASSTSSPATTASDGR